MGENCLNCTVTMKYTREEIYEVIPNRYPLMLLDSLDVQEKDAIGIILLKDDHWFFECHYPGNPIMPMSLLLESMTQTFSSIFLSQVGNDEIPVISSIAGGGSGAIRMRERVVPGDEIRIEAVLSSFRRGVAKGVCYAFKNGGNEPIMEIEIMEVLPSRMVIRT